jgi:hypothetical protein
MRKARCNGRRETEWLLLNIAATAVGAGEASSCVGLGPRVSAAADWAATRSDIGRLPIGCFRRKHGQPYRELLRAAAEQHAGLIVIGAHGHGVLGRMFMGSTAQHIVRQAGCPVLTLRMPPPV